MKISRLYDYSITIRSQIKVIINAALTQDDLWGLRLGNSRFMIRTQHPEISWGNLPLPQNKFTRAKHLFSGACFVKAPV